MKLNISSPVVTVEWLHKNIDAENLVLLDATIKKVGSSEESSEKAQISGAINFDLKGVFLSKESEFPNTVPTSEHFESEVQNLGINNDSCIIIYDDLGVYSSPRAWFLFRLFGFTNVAVLNGGLPKWKDNGYKVVPPNEMNLKKGNFKVKEISGKVVDFNVVSENINSQEFCVADARSNDRFLAKVPEPRKDLKGGHIPNSLSLPYTEVQHNGEMKSQDELQQIFNSINTNSKNYIFTCGSGITACILALALEITGNTNYSVYDGSWTEWASIPNLPIEQ
ncbi:sulfurtransferase [Tenacibaculum sp. 190524A05c]|uniref:Thiosulfate/3-mercaptopyruvate sulfurtransferase n=1 Tax=Tenacibaculum platacis TaxID=3137852 RepID=A0ABM9P4X0_9FLAO